MPFRIASTWAGVSPSSSTEMIPVFLPLSAMLSSWRSLSTTSDVRRLTTTKLVPVRATSSETKPRIPCPSAVPLRGVPTCPTASTAPSSPTSLNEPPPVASSRRGTSMRSSGTSSRSTRRRSPPHAYEASPNSGRAGRLPLCRRANALPMIGNVRGRVWTSRLSFCTTPSRSDRERMISISVSAGVLSLNIAESSCSPARVLVSSSTWMTTLERYTGGARKR